MQSRLSELTETVNRRLENVEMFVDEEKALDYLEEKGRITNKDFWLKALSVVKNLNFLIIKWANDVRELEMKNGLI